MKTTFFIGITALFFICFDATTQTKITTAEELAAINNDIHSLSDNYVLMNNITVDNWTPIGKNKNSFSGTFEGNGFTITINSINALSQNDNYLTGLFGDVGKKGTIKNLRVDGTISYSGTDKDNCAGGIAGASGGTDGKIKNSYATGNIMATGNEGSRHS